jgi:ATP-binding cassette subfamily E protein 1
MTRIAIIEKKKCNHANCGNFLCMRICPVNRKGDECIFQGPDHKAGIDEKLCIGCGICVKKCPYEAISIINLPEQLKRPPIHCFGKNGFHLFSLPMPLFGKVTGIIGKNGIGKTTAISILSGQLRPNLGRPGHKAELKELVEYFKGTELHNYFEKLDGGKITVAVKPQQVSLIPKHFKGTVEELLKQMDEGGKLKEIAEKLELSAVLKRGVSQVSGGELQRVAIAACVLKKANVYFFDEPSSFLDIKQRIKVSKFIRGLADENTAVVVIEHDLIILDYMTDQIHITFGQPSAYGVVSSLMATKEGINEYLHGFLRKENLRFRPGVISFQDKPPVKQAQGENLVEWDKVSKKLGTFTFDAAPGGLNKKHIVGVLGENGIGKTTFVRLLAGEIAPDKGGVTRKVTIAYKPQYIDTDSEQTVMEFLKEAVSGFANELIHPLELDKLMNEQLRQLSGGELQRVMIAKTLSQKEAELFLLDEPSAYLDVEQRLVASKIISALIDNSGKTALIVDHDLLFLDYLSHDLIVCEGRPAAHGVLKGPFSMESGMNMFLTSLDITMRRDQESRRPRINKPDSRLDREQKGKEKLYYS